MSKKLSRLEFIIGLVDKASGPAGKIMAKLDQMSDQYQKGAQKVAYGMAGLVGAGYAMERLIAPSREFQNAVKEVRSLDVAEDVLDSLETKSLRFSVKYGELARDFVASSYDIQSAIAGLSGDELPAFTYASNVLAKGTKATAGIITNYVGTMYGIFKNHADRIGKAQWVEQLAGQTATAVQVFKTDGNKMSQAFATLGADATVMGETMNSQIAILGSLGSTKSGSESGTLYKGFLRGVGKAQEKLGLQFTDTEGKMKPTIEILRLIESKYGDLSKVADSDLLQKAFGNEQATAFIKLLAKDIDGLERSINKIGEVKSMEKAIKMAKAMTDPISKLTQGVTALRIAFGNKLMPVLVPLIEKMSGGTKTLIRWTEMFPTLTRYIGIAALAVLGISAGIAALTIAIGVGTMLMPLFTAGFWSAAGALLAATWPIALVIAGIVALTVATAYVIKNWDKLTARFPVLKQMIAPVINSFREIVSVLGFVWESMKNAFHPVIDAFSVLKINFGDFFNNDTAGLISFITFPLIMFANALKIAGMAIGGLFRIGRPVFEFLAWQIKNMLISLNHFINVFNKIINVGGNLMGKVNSFVFGEENKTIIGNSNAGAPSQVSAGNGGLTQHIINSSNDQSSARSIHIGKIETNQFDSNFINEMEMASG